VDFYTSYINGNRNDCSTDELKIYNLTLTVSLHYGVTNRFKNAE